MKGAQGLEVRNTPNAATPLTTLGDTPLLAIDVREHACYLDYQSGRAAHVAAAIERLNWRAAEEGSPRRIDRMVMDHPVEPGSAMESRHLPQAHANNAGGASAGKALPDRSPGGAGGRAIARAMISEQMPEKKVLRNLSTA